MKKHLKNISKDTLIYLSGSVLTSVGAFFLLPLYAHFLTPEDYGILNYVGTVRVFIEALMFLGMPGTILRFYFDYRNDHNQLKEFLGTVYITVVLFALLIAALIEIVGVLRPFLFSENVSYSPYIRLGIFGAVFSVIPTLSFCFYRAQNRPLKFISFSFISFLMQTGFIVYFVAFKEKGALGSLEGALLAAVIINLVFSYDVYRNINFKFNKEKLLKAIKYGLPLIPISIAGVSMSFAGKFFIEAYDSLYYLGIYSMGVNLANALMLVIVGFKTAWVPFFFDTIDKKNGDQIISKIITIYVLVLLCGALILNSFLYEVIHVLLDQRYQDAYQVVPLIIMAHLFEGFYYMPSSIVLYYKKTHSQAIIVCIIAVISLVLNYVFGKIYGMFGVAATLVLVKVCLFLANYFLGRTCLYMPYEYMKLFKAFSLFAIFYVLISIFNIKGIDYLFIYKLIIIISFPFILYVIGIFTNEEKDWIKSMLRTRIKPYTIP